MSKTITIFSMKLAGYLMLQGFVLVGIGKSDFDSRKNVYFFGNSEEIQKAIKKYNNK